MSDAPVSERFADDARRYRLDSRIATGGMGEVWRGTDTVLGREVAVKLLKPEYADEPSFRSRFETEARHAASLHHPNVAGVFDFGESTATDGSDAPKPYLVMELVDGQPLSVLLRSGEPLDPVAVRELLAQAADAIGAAHAAGIVHRDVKPANLMVTPDRQVKITDFGIARAAEGLGLTETGQVMGTPQYLSPEQARGQAATPASDVYSLGVVAYECLVGQRPFQAETAIATALAHLNDPIPALPASVPADLAAVVRHALEKNPADRFPDAAAFGAALRDPSTAATEIVGAADGGEQTQVMQGVPPVAGAGAAAGLAGAGLAGAGAGAAAGTPYADPTPTPSEPLAPTPSDHRGGGGAGGRLLLIGVIVAAIIAAVVLVVVLGNASDEAPPTDQPTQKSRTKTKPPKTSDAPSESTSEPTEESSSATPSETPTSEKPTPSETPSETPTPTETPSVTPSADPTPTTPPASSPAASSPAATASAADPSASPGKAGDSGSPTPQPRTERHQR
ncbi:protein kinase [Nocardioides sp. KIGAM211]|uniref:non-specific serine/threonine protein kinase n=1 Tax=Nocardioides luti TaxID=2761101 RepID=A0A7X0RGL0_9ACTN|nr:protein kinase [Nocardioides luti]